MNNQQQIDIGILNPCLNEIPEKLHSFVNYFYKKIKSGASGVNINDYIKQNNQENKETILDLISKSKLLSQKILFQDEDIIYLQRIWYYEQYISQRLVYFATNNSKTSIDFYKQLNNLSNNNEFKTQFLENQIEVFKLLGKKQLFLLNGTPGSGKSFILGYILMLILSEYLNAGYPKVIVVTPTAKAKNRIETLFSDLLISHLGKEYVEINKKYELIDFNTIHSLLKITPQSINTIYNPNNNIFANWLVIDEASMVSLEMLYYLLQAVPDDINIIFCGDSDQLPPVKGGCIFGDIFNGFSGNNQIKTKVTVKLEQSKRHIGATKNINDLISSVKSGQLIDFNDSRLLNITIDRTNIDKTKKINNEIYQKAINLNDSKDFEKAIKIFKKTMLLTFNRYGHNGCHQINHRILNSVISKVNPMLNKSYFHALPFIVKKNDYTNGIYNGEIGLFWNQEQKWKAIIPTSDKTKKTFIASTINLYQPAYAITVHESQGSEFDDVVLILANAGSSLNSRELLYTGISRARKSLTIIGDSKAWEECFENTLLSYNGLAKKIKKLLLMKEDYV